MPKIIAPVLEAKGFLLRAAQLGDVQFIAGLDRDASIHRMFGGSAADLKPFSQEEALFWVQRLIDHSCAWVIDAGGVIGEVRLDGIDMQDRRASFAIGILKPAWLGKGIGTQATKLVLNFAFHALHLHRINLRVLAYNSRAIRSYEKCGFMIEGREREAGFVDGAWYDDLIMGILDREFSVGEA
jgi:RimJ/RimL family protein N-acetyltransferase